MVQSSIKNITHKILGIDWGRKYIGIALSDDSRTMAFPYEVVARAGIEKYLIDVYAKQPFATIVIGLPRELDGTDSEYAQSIREDGQKLIEALKQAHAESQISLVFLDERFTSSHVLGGQDKKLHQHRMSRNEGFAKTGERKDAQAAALILQRHLDTIKT
jgi:putative holliday junction resolvase